MRVLLLALLALAGCQTTPAAAPVTQIPAAEPFYHLVDLTGDYEAFFDRTQSMAPDARVAAFKTEFTARFPGFYEPAEGTTQQQMDRMIAHSFEEFPQIRVRYDATRASFANDMAAAQAAFVATFPDAHPVGDIFFVHSLGRMDGGTREYGGHTYFIFGADVMARIHTPGQARPFFNHEIFHFYHAPYFPECEAVWCSLWAEGLAVYVARQINPGASDAALLLTTPRPIRPEVDANLARAACAVKAVLDSERQEDYAPLFFGNGNPPGLPPRFGYYVGYLVAKAAGRTHTVQELAHMPPAQVRPIIDAELASMAPNCPPPAN